MINVRALVSEAVRREGGKRSINIADGSELARLLLEELAALPCGEVGALLARYRRRGPRRPRERRRR